MPQRKKLPRNKLGPRFKWENMAALDDVALEVRFRCGTALLRITEEEPTIELSRDVVIATAQRAAAIEEQGRGAGRSQPCRNRTGPMRRGSEGTP